MAAEPSAATSRWALAALSLAMLMAALGTSIANIALPTLAETFGATFPQVQWVVLAYLLSITTLIVGVGRLGDIFGPRRLLLAGIGLFTFASIACAASPTLSMLIAARAAQGLGAAVLMALSLSLVRDAVPRERTGSAMGLLGTMSAIGTALGPSLGGLLIAGPGWRAIFLVNVPLGLIAAYLAVRHVPRDRNTTPNIASFDSIGTLLLALALLAYALAMTAGRGSFGLLNLALLIGAALATALFVFSQKRVASPLLRLDMFRDRRLTAALAMSVLLMTVMMATLIVGPFYLSGALGLGFAVVGLVMSVGPVVAALTGIPAGRLVDRIGARQMTIAGLMGPVAGCVLLAVIPASAGIAGYVGPLILITAGYAIFQAANNTAVMRDVDAGNRGVVSGMLNLSRNLGLITGASFMGAIFFLAAGAPAVDSAPADAIASGMHGAFAMGALLALIALSLAFIKPTRLER